MDKPYPESFTLKYSRPCPHCHKRPMGVRLQGKLARSSIRNPFMIHGHKCKGGTFKGGYGYDPADVLQDMWTPWVMAQEAAIAEEMGGEVMGYDEPDTPPVVKRSLWQKLWNGWG